jgi:hypothetical protein
MPDDLTTTQHDLTQLVAMLAAEAAKAQDPKWAPHAAREEREAARWLYEQLATYRGMLIKRALTRSVEFISGGPPGSGFHQQPGWYFKGPEGPDGKSHPRNSFNWYGPYGSHREAQIARDERANALGLTAAKHVLNKYLELAANA